MSAISDMADLWDAVVAGWLDGDEAVTDELQPWLNAYRGSGEGSVVVEALPEPWFGSLAARPAMVFLALNPGQVFLGTQPWHRNGPPMPDLQSRHGVFADEIRTAGSYSRWAERFPEWNRWAPSPNRFFVDRTRFAQRWLDRADLTIDDCANVELYPWHSYVFHTFTPDDTTRALIGRYVLDPIRESGCDAVFAFGAPWFGVLESLGFRALGGLSIRDGDTWPNAPKDRVITVFEREGLKVVAEKHSGSAAPPKASEIPHLRQRLVALTEGR